MVSRLLAFFLIPTAHFAQVKNAAERADSVLALMTLEELVGQTNHYTGFWNATGPMPEGNDWLEARVKALKNGLVGSVLNVSGVAEVRALQKVVVEESLNKNPYTAKNTESTESAEFQ